MTAKKSPPKKAAGKRTPTRISKPASGARKTGPVAVPPPERDDVVSELGRRIRDRLAEIGMKPAAASIAASQSKDFVRNIYRGKSGEPRHSALARLAVVIGVTPEWLREGLGATAGRSVVFNTDDEGRGRGRPRKVDPLSVELEINSEVWRPAASEAVPVMSEPVPVVRDPRFETRQYLARIMDDTMAPCFPKGAFLHVVEFPEGGVTAIPNDARPARLFVVVSIVTQSPPLRCVMAREVHETQSTGAGKVTLLASTNPPRSRPSWIAEHEGKFYYVTDPPKSASAYAREARAELLGFVAGAYLRSA